MQCRECTVDAEYLAICQSDMGRRVEKVRMKGNVPNKLKISPITWLR